MRGICLGIYIYNKEIIGLEESLTELKLLSETIEIEVVDTIVFRLKEINPATLITSFMIEELKTIIEKHKIEVIIFNDELKPNQQRNLEKETGIMVIDRTELILRIFENNARTAEAKTQVEIAKLKYMLPRLKRMWTHLSRIEGGYGFTKGPGEKQIEIDKRLIKRRISKLTEKLKEIESNRNIIRQKRLTENIPIVSIIGYTNAGKTALLNTLSKAQLLSENRLFSTLSPVIRKVFINGKIVLFADTVGFINKLPTQLIASFKSTLEEIKYSRLLLILQDSSSSKIKDKLNTVFSTLDEIGCSNKKYILCFSKIDMIDRESLKSLMDEYPLAIPISSLTGKGIDKLKKRIFNELFKET
ncbi:MAG TPA: GTPase HflX [Spirochaetota bacterium]|nr:GTPase HflX [Spirochaetota bacterium]HOM37693.1 GTPase HflX [Spirochaetota bacterium]HPQ49651.1 GTPase HflX [Spirochaetota bacterium]